MSVPEVLEPEVPEPDEPEPELPEPPVPPEVPLVAVVGAACAVQVKDWPADAPPEVAALWVQKTTRFLAVSIYQVELGEGVVLDELAPVLEENSGMYGIELLDVVVLGVCAAAIPRGRASAAAQREYGFIGSSCEGKG